MFEDTKGVIRIRKSKKDKQHNGGPKEKGQTTQWPKEKDKQHNGQKKKDKQHNGQKKKDKQWSKKHCTKNWDRATRTPLKTGGELRCSGRVAVPAPHSAETYFDDHSWVQSHVCSF